MRKRPVKESPRKRLQHKQKRYPCRRGPQPPKYQKQNLMPRTLCQGWLRGCCPMGSLYCCCKILARKLLVFQAYAEQESIFLTARTVIWRIWPLTFYPKDRPITPKPKSQKLLKAWEFLQDSIFQ